MALASHTYIDSVSLPKPLLSTNPKLGDEGRSLSLRQLVRPRNSSVGFGAFPVALVLPVERCPARPKYI